MKPVILNCCEINKEILRNVPITWIFWCHLKLEHVVKDLPHSWHTCVWFVLNIEFLDDLEELDDGEMIYYNIYNYLPSLYIEFSYG